MNRSILIQNGKIHDGERFLRVCDLLIKNDRIAAVGDLSSLDQANLDEIIDASGCVVCPGLIETHNMTHRLDQLNRNDAINLTAQGVTTCLIGNCGESGELDTPQAFERRIRYLQDIELGINVGCLVGHNSIRRFVANAPRPATPAEINEMSEMLDEALECGAFGMSSGLMYAPGIFADATELHALAAVVGKHEKIYTSHMRDEGEYLHESVLETLDTARAGNARLIISHYKTTGIKYWGKTRETTKLIEERRSKNEIYVTFYPYTATSTVLKVVILPEILQRIEGDLSRLQYNERDEQLIEERGKQNLCRNGWEDVVIASSSLSDKVNKSIGSLAGQRSGYEVVIKILREDPNTRVVFHNIISEEEMFEVSQLPYAITVSDGYVYATGSQEATHPRNYGAFARVLGRYVMDKQLVKLEEFISRNTSLAAHALRLRDRGRLRETYFADVAILRPGIVEDRATYEQPYLLATGVTHTIVNGQIVFQEGRAAGRYAGRFVQ